MQFGLREEGKVRADFREVTNEERFLLVAGGHVLYG